MSHDNDDDVRGLLAALARETEARDDEVMALRRTLARRTTDARVSRALLRHLPDAAPDEIEAVRLGVRRARARRRSPLVPLVLGAGAFGLVAALALAVVAARLLAPGGPSDRPIDVALAPGEPGSTSPSPGVALSWQGAGSVGGTEANPEIRWTQGKVGVEVEPGRGIGLTVVTREAEVRVIGTVFDVERDALGTRVDVRRGTVGVDCAAGDDHVLHAGDTVTCAPTTAPGLLGRANALKAAGAPPAEVLTAVDAGLPTATGPFAAELLALRTEMLAEVGRDADAVDAADRYLAAGGPRRIDVLRIAAGSALAVGGCARALPYLHQLEDAGEGDPDQLARCEDAP